MAPSRHIQLRPLMIYALLAMGSIVFSLPFLWMIGTSFKMDRELSSTQLSFVPQTPRPALRSPYLDSAYYPPPKSPHWPLLEPIILARLEACPTPPHKGLSPSEQARLLAPGIFQRLQQVLPDDLWRADPQTLKAAATRYITPDLISGVLDKVNRRLIFGALRVRSLNLQEKALTDECPPAHLFNVTSGPAQWEEAGTETAILHYDFSAHHSQEAILTARLQLPFRADHLRRIQLSLTPDDSWHEISVFLEMNGIRYQTMQRPHLGGTQEMMLTLQAFGPDDRPDSNKIKLWVPYREIDRSADYDHGPDQVRMTMVIHKSSQLTAWKIKCLRNYRKTLAYIPFWRYTATSALLVILNIIGTVFSCSLAAYAFARLHWPGRTFSFALMLATMMIPPQVTMIPYFLIIRALGWYNTLTPLWIMSVFGNAFNIFLLRQFMKGIPRDLEDAARIDGCNFLQIYWHVMMPLIKPSLICIAVFTFMAVWNDFMGPLIFISDQRLYPLSLGLYALKVQQGEFGMMMAASLLMTLPVIAVFFVAQRYFIQGIALTGTKG